jgi:hypothetical protein
MVDSTKAAVLAAGLPEMPDEIFLAPEKKAINWKRIFFILLGLGIFFCFTPSLPAGRGGPRRQGLQASLGGQNGPGAVPHGRRLVGL